MRQLAVDPKELHPTKGTLVAESLDDPEYADTEVYVLKADDGFAIYYGHICAYNQRDADSIDVTLIETQADYTEYLEVLANPNEVHRSNPELYKELARITDSRAELSMSGINHLHDMVVVPRADVLKAYRSGGPRITNGLETVVDKMQEKLHEE